MISLLPFLLLASRYHRHRGRRDLAKERLKRAVDLVPDSFQAHLRLGVAYLEEHDFYRAKREFLMAREIRPGKFRRLYPLITGATGDVNINLFYFPGYTDCEQERPAPKNFLRDFIGEPRGEPRGEAREEPVHAETGDFASYGEVRKFREMGPFRADELTRLDWTELERQFQEDAESLEN
ncbi:MAG: hypothetical protein ABFS86_03080 [Planctomycetota bacterium]